MSRFKTPRALEMAVKEAAKASPLDTGRAVSGFYFHRFLCRVFSGSNSAYVLKGGHAVLARTLDARYTRDIDLGANQIDVAEAVNELEMLASIDLDDFLTYELVSVEPIKIQDKYRDGFTLRFSASLGAKAMCDITVDLVADQVEYSTLELISPADRLDVAGLSVCDYPVYSVERALTDKFFGIVERYNGRPSSRVKDLVDIVIYLKTESVYGSAIRKLLCREFSMRGLGALSDFALPEEWGELHARRYEKLAAQANLDACYLDMNAAESLARRFYHWVLSDSSEERSWSPASLDWELDAPKNE